MTDMGSLLNEFDAIIPEKTRLSSQKPKNTIWDWLSSLQPVEPHSKMGEWRENLPLFTAEFVRC